MKIVSVSNTDSQKVATVVSSPASLRFVYMLIALSAGVTLDELSDNYELVELAKPNNPAADPVPPKHYLIRHKTDASMVLRALPDAGLPTLFPPRKRPLDRASGSDRWLSRLENATTEQTLEQAVSELPATEVVRYARFAVEVAARDQACVVTNNDNVEACVGAHVIPHAWGRYGTQHLPQDVRLKLYETGNGLNDVSNGIYLASNFHDSFDKGYWSVIWRDLETGEDVPLSEYGTRPGVGSPEAGWWRTVRLHVRAPVEVDGRRLIFPTDRSGKSWVERFPPVEFWAYHFQTAVLANCRGAAEENEPFIDEFDRMAHQLAFCETVY